MMDIQEIRRIQIGLRAVRLCRGCKQWLAIEKFGLPSIIIRRLCHACEAAKERRLSRKRKAAAERWQR